MLAREVISRDRNDLAAAIEVKIESNKYLGIEQKKKYGEQIQAIRSQMDSERRVLELPIQVEEVVHHLEGYLKEGDKKEALNEIEKLRELIIKIGKQKPLFEKVYVTQKELTAIMGLIITIMSILSTIILSLLS